MDPQYDQSYIMKLLNEKEAEAIAKKNARERARKRARERTREREKARARDKVAEFAKGNAGHVISTKVRNLGGNRIMLGVMKKCMFDCIIFDPFDNTVSVTFESNSEPNVRIFQLSNGKELAEFLHFVDRIECVAPLGDLVENIDVSKLFENGDMNSVVGFFGEDYQSIQVGQFKYQIAGYYDSETCMFQRITAPRILRPRSVGNPEIIVA
jgi:hypothetical protein